MTGVSVAGIALVAVGGAAGSVARVALDRLLTRAVAARTRAGDGARAPFPVGIVAINLLGSLLLGVLVGALGLVPHLGGVVGGTPEHFGGAARLVSLALGTGLLGGFTTLSTASLDTVRLAQAGRFGAAAAHALGTLGGAVGCAIAGLWAGVALLEAFT